MDRFMADFSGWTSGHSIADATAASDELATIPHRVYDGLWEPRQRADVYTWDTRLWKRKGKPELSRRVDQIQRRLTFASGARQRSRLEMELIRVGEEMRALSGR